MSRDRDPFERALEVLRLSLRHGAGLQGRPLAINLLAQQIGVSHTPVREALAWLAGEDLIVRTAAGYVGRTFDAGVLAETYRFNAALTTTALRSGAVPHFGFEGAAAGEPEAVFAALVQRAGDRTLLTALRRTRERLAPFALAEAEVLNDASETSAELCAPDLDPTRARAIVRGYYRRRARASGSILAVTLSRLQI